MRRLELVEGASSKFWEIQLEGSGFTVRWGRIGTNGQTQQKNFATEQKAKDEHDKLLAEKLKKGYAEVGASASVSAPTPPPAKPAKAPKVAAAPAPVEEVVEAPAPVPVPVPVGVEVIDARPIAWDDELVKRVHPRRGGMAVPVRALAEPGKAWKSIQNAYGKLSWDVGVKGVHASGEFEAPYKALLSRMGAKTASIGTPEEDALLLTILQYKRNWGDKPNVDPVIDLLFSLGGPEHATRAVLLAVDVHVENQNGTYSLLRGMDPGGYNALNWNPRGLPRLRALLATQAADAGYSAARDAAALLRSTPHQRTVAAFLFPTEGEWVRQEAREYTTEQRFDGIACSVSDRESLALVAPLLSFSSIIHGGLDFLPTVLEGVGVDAMVLLTELKSKAWSSEPRAVWAEALSVINSDEALALLLESSHEKEVLARVSEVVNRWPRRAVRLLAPKAAARGKAGDTPRALLMGVVRRVPAAFTEELAGLPEDVRKAVAGLSGDVGPDVPDAMPERVPPMLVGVPEWKKQPSFFDAAALPRPLLSGRQAQLPLPAVVALGQLLASSDDPEKPSWELKRLRELCDRESLARFAWALFEAWLLAGAPNKESWAFKAVGVFGDDACARKLVPLIRQWPGESAHQRAVLGLDVLAAIGTDVTLTYLNGIAEKVKFKALQQRAQNKVSALAEARGLSREELADRLVPDLGLEDNGSLQLDFGERTFTVGFDEQLKPYVKDAEGARLKDLPKPTKKDDAEKAGAADERWKALKKDAKAAAAIQVLRMELGMCAKRRWKLDAFQQCFVEHPLLIHIVRRLVWGSYDSNDKLLATFRVAEDRSFADRNDDAWTLAGARVGIPHPLELEAQTAAAWGQVFADYQLLQPFAQLGRPVYTATPEEKKGAAFKRVEGLKVPTGKVLGLEQRGWRRGSPQDGGVVCWMEKTLPGDRVLMLDLDPGLYTGYLSESPEQKLGPAVLRTDTGWGDTGRIPLGELDPILFSELARDLEGLRP